MHLFALFLCISFGFRVVDRFAVRELFLFEFYSLISIVLDCIKGLDCEIIQRDNG